MNFKKLKVGRNADNDIVINHTTVSRYHCEFFFDPEGNIFLTDLNSTNGTFVNGNRIKDAVQIQPTDIVKLGLSDPIPWRDFMPITDKTTSGIDNNEVFEAVKETPNQLSNTPKKPFKFFRFILILLFVTLAVLAALYLYNEKTNDISIIDPDKPNKEGEKPSNAEISKNDLKYNYDCLHEENDGGIIGLGRDILTDVAKETGKVLGGEVSVEEEEKLGKNLFDELKKENKFISSGLKYDNLQVILKRLTKHINKPRGFNYKLYLLESNEINAFTAGGYIFFTTKMYEFCQNNDEIACIIGHEIYHNERGHIAEHIQKERLLGKTGAGLFSLLTISFNQRNELECDFHGIDLAISAGYNGCVTSTLWKRMAEQHHEDKNLFDDLMRSHPYSKDRATCAKKHIKENYKFDCP